MKRVEINTQPAEVQEFLRCLPLDHEGCILQLEGKALLKVLPITEAAVNKSKLKAAILKRRAESRKTNEDWEQVDRQMWDSISKTEGSN